MWYISDRDISAHLYNNLFLVHIKTFVNCMSKKRIKFTYPHIKKFVLHNFNSYLSKSNRKAMNRDWDNQKANPSLKTNAGNK